LFLSTRYNIEEIKEKQGSKWHYWSNNGRREDYTEWITSCLTEKCASLKDKAHKTNPHTLEERAKNILHMISTISGEELQESEQQRLPHMYRVDLVRMAKCSAFVVALANFY